MGITTKLENLLGGSLLDGVSKIITLFKVPPEQVEQHAFELQELQIQMAKAAMDAATAQAHDQASIDLAEAQSGSWFARNWRPAIGWTCALGLFSQFIIRPMFTWVAALCGHPEIVYPALDLSTLLMLVFSMLGIGAHQAMTEGFGGDSKNA